MLKIIPMNNIPRTNNEIESASEKLIGHENSLKRKNSKIENNPITTIDWIILIRYKLYVEIDCII